MRRSDRQLRARRRDGLNSGHAESKNGVAFAGHRGKASADENGCVVVTYYDEKAKRFRVAVGYVGEEGIEARATYGVKDGKLAKVTT